MKLYAREALLQFAEEVQSIITSINQHAKLNVKTVMPGYTHHRKATVTSWGHWCASYSQGLLRDAQRLVSLYPRLNTCPLGAAASYGTTWDLQRLKVAKWLGFDTLQENTLDAVVSRGESEADMAFALSMLLKRLSVISQDIILFSTDEFGYFKLPTEMTTGSSIMPQKRNPDFAEAIKGKFHVVQGYANSLLSMNAGNQSGYNKDVQWSKYVFMDAVRESFGAASMLVTVFDQLKTNKEIMKQAAERGFLNAVDFADFLAASRDIPFRKTYTILSEAVGKAQSDRFDFGEMNAVLEGHSIQPLNKDEFNKLSDPMQCLLSRPHAGSPNPDQVLAHLKQLNGENQNLNKWINQTRRSLLQAKRRCEKL
jgi:argininosuccinate lyase